MSKTEVAQSPPISLLVIYYDNSFNFLDYGLITNIAIDSIPSINEKNIWLEIYQTTGLAPLGTTQALVLINKLPLVGSSEILVDDVALLEVNNGVTGPTGPTGVTGITGPTGPTANVPTLAFVNTSGSITVFPPLNTEVTVASVTTNLIAGEDVKIDYGLGIQVVTSANSNIILEMRLYRGASLLQSRIFNRTLTTAATQRFPLADTFVDTAPSTEATTYQLRIIVTTANNVTSTTAVNRNLNLIIFP